MPVLEKLIQIPCSLIQTISTFNSKFLSRPRLMIGIRLIEFSQIAITKEPVRVLYLLVNEFVTLLCRATHPWSTHSWGRGDKGFLLSVTHAGRLSGGDWGIVGHRRSCKGSLPFPRFPALLALGIGEENLGLNDSLIRPLGSGVLFCMSVMVCNTFCFHDINELEKWNGSNIVKFYYGGRTSSPRSKALITSLHVKELV